MNVPEPAPSPVVALHQRRAGRMLEQGREPAARFYLRSLRDVAAEAARVTEQHHRDPQRGARAAAFRLEADAYAAALAALGDAGEPLSLDALMTGLDPAIQTSVVLFNDPAPALAATYHRKRRSSWWSHAPAYVHGAAEARLGRGVWVEVQIIPMDELQTQLVLRGRRETREEAASALRLWVALGEAVLAATAEQLARARRSLAVEAR